MESRGFVPVAQLAQPDGVFSEASLLGIFQRILPPHAPAGTPGGESRAAKIAEKLAAKAQNKDVGGRAAELFATPSDQPSRTAVGGFVREDVYVVLPGALGTAVGIKFRQDDPAIPPALEVKVEMAPANDAGGTADPPTFAKAAITLEELGHGDAASVDFAAGLAWVGSQLERTKQTRLLADYRAVLARLPEPNSSAMVFGDSRITGATLPLVGVAKVRVKKSESLFKKLGAVEAVIEATLVRTRILGRSAEAPGCARYFMSVCCEGGVDAHLVASNACWRGYAAATPGVIVDGYPGFAAAVLGQSVGAPQAAL